MGNEVRQTRFAPPPGAADLLLIRHGESMPAIRGESFPLKDGHGNPALHPDGEARAVAARLQDTGVAAIYVTSLQRTQQTAAPLAERLGIAPKVEADLRKVYLGDWDGGLYRFRAAELDPAFERAKALHEWGEIPGAESTAALHDRVRAALLRIAQAHPDQRIAVFVIGAAMSIATGARPLAFNDTAHLD